ncbi:hypothetical protein D8674_013377 [Pyrus ussuriensis x Pyrus communis]|uniref:Uncharacterized protein n=1 Tax=Pyrus ussuriensis x Pyrus communis TaxID=2448454 RepID=A0A5N5GQG6_9ROSA|nr:uncharacterized protein LOC125476239 [Pyrus x bretschneideri]KAB2617508.1 hypothetical protein D8674_013377 [Pyrus ussuriensis x Pyrus communis]
MSTFTSTDLCKWHSRLFVKPPGLFRHVSSSTLKCQQGFRTNHALLPLTIGQRSSLSNQPCRKNKIVCNSFPLPGVPGPSHSWKGWLIGIVLSVILPFSRSKWGPLLALKKEVDMIVDTVEAVVEVVEQVAEKVEEVADDIGDSLPEGKLKTALELVENIAKEAAKDAHLADELIEKAEALEDRVEDFFESALDKAGDVIKDVGDESDVQVATEKKTQ